MHGPMVIVCRECFEPVARSTTISLRASRSFTTRLTYCSVQWDSLAIVRVLAVHLLAPWRAWSRITHRIVFDACVRPDAHTRRLISNGLARSCPATGCVVGL